ncbi:MAG TPA: carboxypeptidase regulatory-like domain-containing protein [Saprospiraceae bacterium]|nr:carboxypeptidase regulatory-like domain-containing protein [Saprospiraceae bacterium]
MKYSSTTFPSAIRVLAILVFFTIGQFTDLDAQVRAIVTASASARQGEKDVHISWSAQDESKWHEANDGMLDIMSLKTQIGKEVFQPKPNEFSVSQLTFDHPCKIECLIKVNTIASSESIYLYDKNTGDLIFDFKSTGKSSFLTPSFNPETTSIIWRTRGGGAAQSDFSIENIYFDPTDSRGDRDIGFGTALACHPNAACKTDSLSKLISNSDVRIRLVMEEGIGWCTGTMINNTRNDKSPLLLTAYHCTFNFTPHYDMWRFDFQYTSPTCPNPPVEPQFFSLTGCELKASGQASDFLLVRLNNDIPADQPVTIAGWDRDINAIPDTTYLVHHPNADIRKFSTCINPAVIHPNQIGWAEGYTTQAFHHFRLKFTEGGHEKGSSGGGVYNQDFHLIGQLHGGTSGCEITNNAYIGRLSKSWDLGPTSSQRLKDWLDPDNTGVVQLESLENISPGQIVDIHGIVKDPLGRPVKNVKIVVTGSKEEEMITDADGKFNLAQVNRNGQYTFTPEKNINQANGLNVFDLLDIQKHLLAKQIFPNSWQLIAADATNNGDITVGDILLILKLILGKIQYYPSSNSWRFDPPSVQIDSLPPGEPNEVQIMGIKIGDVNGNADPGQ